MPYTEEDIKVKFVLPYLKSLGFSEDELTLEKSFTIRLGKNAVRIDTEESIKLAHPRLDILVTRDGKNLFVMEVKADSQTLTDEDRDQAISYARLVHPMVPISIVTNGKSTKVYKTVDKVEVSWNKEEILGYKCEEDLKDIHDEALKYFIGYSKENIRLFCGQQVNSGMSTLLGSANQPHKKFIPDLYVSSKQLTKAFKGFRRSEKNVFAMVGDSGSGKTCSMCGLARDHIEDYPVLFYRANSLINGIGNAIAEDFNWAFSPQQGEIHLIKRLTKIFQKETILIFIDAVDEWENRDKVENLGNFASHIQGQNIKLVLSCKSRQWEDFLDQKGIPTNLSEHVYSIEEKFTGYLVTPFQDQEFWSLIEKHRTFYGFQGLFEDQVLEECRHSPFLVRIFFEVAKKTGYPHLSFSVRDFFEEYYDGVLERISSSDRDIAKRTLTALGKLYFELNQDTVPEDIIREKLSLRIHEPLLPALFEANILEKLQSEDETRIGFYFKKLRDYVIAFHSEKLNLISTEDFRTIWNESFWLGVKHDVAVLFYQFADPEKKRVIDGPIWEKAREYLSSYTEIINTHFPSFRHQFQPHTTKKIGFLGILDILAQRIVAYGFRPISEGDEEIKLLPFTGSFWGGNGTNLPHLLGARVMSHRDSLNGFWTPKIREEALENEILSQLKDIIRVGLLNETNCFYLSLEKAIGLTVELQRDLHEIRDIGNLSEYLPLEIERIEYGIRYKKTKRHLEHKFIKTNIDKGLIPTSRSGSSVIYSPQLTQQDWESIDHQAHEMALDKSVFKSCVSYPAIEHQERVLEEALITVKTRTNVIGETIFPDRDCLPTTPVAMTWDFFKKETLKIFIQKLYSLFLSEYKAIIETNFPTLKNYFRLYSELPVHLFILVEPENKYGIEIFECSNNENGRNEVSLYERHQIEYDGKAMTLKWEDNIFKVNQHVKTWIGGIMPSSGYYFSNNSNHQFFVLRHTVYRTILNELSNIYPALRLER